MKRKIPTFRRQHSHVGKVRRKNWRKPRGKHSRQKHEKRNKGALPTTGYRQPKKLRGLHACGLMEARVFRAEDITKFSPEKHALRIAGGVGTKKKLEIIKKAEELKFRVINLPTKKIALKEKKKQETVKKE